MGKPKVVARIGYIEVAPSSSSKAVVKSSGGKRGWTDAFTSQNTTKAVCKDTATGGGRSVKFTKTEKAGGFVDKRSGNHGFKQEVNYKSAVKVNDKAQGCTTEYETQVKFKKTTTYTAPKKTASAAVAGPPKPKSSGSGYKSFTYHDYGY